VILERLSRRTARVRAARHVRDAVRGDRSHRGTLPYRHEATREPRPPLGAWRTPIPDTDLTRQREVVDAFFAAARGGDFDALVGVLDREVVLRADGGLVRPGLSREVRGARAVAEQALTFARLAPFARPALVNGAAGVVVAPARKPYAVMDFTVRGEKIVEIDILADPGRLRQLDLLALLDD
jgi:RNA polymerase sigma-70 factor (ECF subfamily)